MSDHLPKRGAAAGPDARPDSDEFVSLGDVIAFLRRWRRLLPAFVALGIIGGTVFALATPRYASEYIFEPSRVNTIVLKDAKLINQGLASAFGQYELSRVFAAHLVAELTRLEKGGDAMADSAKRALRTLASVFGDGQSGAVEDGLIRYLNNAVVDQIRTGKPSKDAPFNYLIENVDGYNYRLSLVLKERGSALAMVAATAKALDALIIHYNNQENEARRSVKRDREQKAKEAFETTAKEYFAISPELERERTAVLADFYRLESRVQKLERKAGITRSGPSAAFPVLGLDMNSVNQEQSDSVTLVESLETKMLAKRIADLREHDVIDEKGTRDMLVELTRLQTARGTAKAKYEAASRAFYAAQEEINRVYTEVAMTIRPEEFALPPLADQYTPSFIERNGRGFDQNVRSLLKFALLGAAVLGLLGVSVALVMQAFHQPKGA